MLLPSFFLKGSKLTVTILMLSTVFLVSFWSVNCNAATDIIGFISSNTTWTAARSPYVTKGNILVKEGVTLTIEPGVAVELSSGHSLIINGTLIAKGTQQEGIKFTAEQATKPGVWGGIVFEDSSQGAKFDDAGNYVSGSMLQYCTLESAETPIKANSTSLFIAHSIISNSGTISISEGQALVIRDSRFSDNTGIVVKNTRGVTLVGNTFTGNSAGGIYAEVGTATISNNNFTGNKARNGGGTYVKCDNATITNNTFTGNQAVVEWLQKGHGGGLYIEASMATIANNTFTENLVTGKGHSFGGGAYVKCDNATIDDNKFIANYARGYEYQGHGWGGGLYVQGGHITITNNTFTGNKVTGGVSGVIHIRYGADALGGGFYIQDSTATVTNNSFTGNETIGGRKRHGAGVYVIRGTTTIINSTFISNEAAIGSAIYYSGSQKIANNFIANNAGAREENSNAVYIEGNPIFTGNTIIDNQTEFDLFYDQPKGSPNLNASNNYWGAVTETEIRVRINDFFADERKALVDVVPFLKSRPTQQSDLHPYVISEGHYEIGMKKTFSTHDETGRPITKTLEVVSADVENDRITINTKVTFDEVEGYSPGRVGAYGFFEAKWPNHRINTTKASLSKVFKITEESYKWVQTCEEISRTGIFTSELQMKQLQKGKSYSGSFSFPLPQEMAYLPQERTYLKLRIDWPSKTRQSEILEMTNILFRLLPKQGGINLSYTVDQFIAESATGTAFSLPVRSEGYEAYFPWIASHIDTAWSIILPTTFQVTDHGGIPISGAKIFVGQQKLGVTDSSGKFTYKYVVRIPKRENKITKLPFSAKKNGASCSVDIPFSWSVLEKTSIHIATKEDLNRYTKVLYQYEFFESKLPLPKELTPLSAFLPLLKVAYDRKIGPKIGDRIDILLIEHKIDSKKSVAWAYWEQIKRGEEIPYYATGWILSSKDKQRILDTYFLIKKA